MPDADAPIPRPGHDIIAIGASAGGLQALQCILHDLPADLPAAVCIVQHVGRSSHLVEILGRAGALPVVRPESGDPVLAGRVYVAPPDRHLLLHDRHLLLRRGPHENLVRPAIDPLFRSAGASFGSRVIGVVLSGALNDGTAGLRAIKRCGGLAVVQDPLDASVPEMPLSALRKVEIDFRLPASRLGALLADLTRQPAGPTPPIPFDIRLEAAISAQELADMVTEDRLGTPSRFVCPACRGALWEIEDGAILRYRCHTGHAFTGEALLAAQAQQIETTLWNLLRGHQERAGIFRRLAEQETSCEGETRLTRRADEADKDAALVRSLLSGPSGIATAEELGDDAV
jgi:two-component system chemotaxis response regulator CheB